MQTLFAQEVGTGFQTHPARREIAVWVGKEYHGHITERTFSFHELDGLAIKLWLSGEAGHYLREH